MPYQSPAPWAAGCLLTAAQCPGLRGPAAPAASLPESQGGLVLRAALRATGLADMSSCLPVPSGGGGWPAGSAGLIPTTGARMWEEWGPGFGSALVF